MRNELLKTLTELLEKKSVPLTVIKDKVRYRRAHVVKYLLRGMKQKEIARRIECSLSTIEKDVQFLKKSCQL